jgi:hypothetical protein
MAQRLTFSVGRCPLWARDPADAHRRAGVARGSRQVASSLDQSGPKPNPHRHRAITTRSRRRKKLRLPGECLSGCASFVKRTSRARDGRLPERKTSANPDAGEIPVAFQKPVPPTRDQAESCLTCAANKKRNDGAATSAAPPSHHHGPRQFRGGGVRPKPGCLTGGFSRPAPRCG